MYDILLWAVGMIIVKICSDAPYIATPITIDGMYYAIDFIKNNIVKNTITEYSMTESQILMECNNLYNVEILERYLFYFGLYALYMFITYFIFNFPLGLLRYLFAILLIPSIFNNYVHKYLHKIFSKFTHEKKEFIKKLCFDQVANILVHLKSKFLNDKNITKQDILLELNKINSFEDEIYKFGKNVLITLFILHMRKTSVVYYKAIKYIYKMTVGEEIHNMTVDESKKMLQNMLNDKKYEQLTKPMFIQAMIYLYCENDSGSAQKYINMFKYDIASITTLWAFGDFFTYYSKLFVILSISTLLFVGRIWKSRDIQKTYRFIASTISTCAATYITFNSLLLSIVNVFFGNIIFNKFVRNVAYAAYVLLKNKIVKIFKITHRNVTTIMKYIVFATLYRLCYIHNLPTYIFPIFCSYMDTDKYLNTLMYVGFVNNCDNYLKILAYSYILACIDNIKTSDFSIEDYVNPFTTLTYEMSFNEIIEDENKENNKENNNKNNKNIDMLKSYYCADSIDDFIIIKKKK